MIGKSDDLTILKTLTSTVNDSINGYRDAAEHVERGDLKDLFTRSASERGMVVQQLQAEVRRLGGDPDQDGSTMGALHQRWLDFKAAFTGRDDKAIVDEVERGEDYLKGKFEAALKDDGVTGESRAVVESAWTSVKAGHDQVSALKHGMEV